MRIHIKTAERDAKKKLILLVFVTSIKGHEFEYLQIFNLTKLLKKTFKPVVTLFSIPV